MAHRGRKDIQGSIMDYWAKPGLSRRQTLLFHPTLDDCIDNNHPVRHLHEILQAQDWSAWTQHYDGRHGQPPIPPWVMAGTILYGLMRRIRSARQLEYACTHNIDFMWLTERRTIDHDTICKFRTKFKKPLQHLFKQIGRVAMAMGLIQLVEVAFDGTRVKADASRFHTWTAEKLEKVLAELEAEVGRMLSEAAATDAADATLWGEGPSRELPEELADAKKRQARLRQTLVKLRAADAARKQDGIDPQKNPAQLPKADTDAKVMPNKEGGYAPNYTPLAATDGTGGLIVDCDVIGGPNEHQELLPSVDRIRADFGRNPGAVAADAAFGTGANLKGMEERGVDFYTPVDSPAPQEGNPARRADPRTPVPAAEWPKLPRNDKNKLDKSCFVYDEAADCYSCPLGKVMRYTLTNKRERSGETVPLRIYRCEECSGCPLAGDCLDPQAKRGRTVRRDGYEPLREKMHAKLQTEEGKETYHRRMHTGETPFAVIKGIMEVRRFLLRGLGKVQTEWQWVCTAYNLKKLIAVVAALRAQGGTRPVCVGG
jgi:transposase